MENQRRSDTNIRNILLKRVKHKDAPNVENVKKLLPQKVLVTKLLSEAALIFESGHALPRPRHFRKP